MLWWLACTPKSPPTEAHVVERGRSELVLAGTLEQRVSNLDADLVLFYGGELRGNLGTCGCGERPRGGLGRVASYVRASERRSDAAHLLFFNGYWLDDRPGAAESNALLLQAFDALGVDAANATTHDLPGIGSSPPVWALSANVEGLASSRVFELDGHTVGVVAVGAPGSLATVGGRRLTDPVEGALEAIDGLDVDLVVLMTWGMPEEVSRIAWDADVDVIIDAAQHQGFFQPVDVDDTVVVRAQFETTRLGELRIDWDQGVLVDRQIDLDEGIPEDEQLRVLRERADELL